MLDRILGGLVGFIAVVFALGFVLPDRAHVEREIVINAPPEKIYAHISDLNAWGDWAPEANERAHAEQRLITQGFDLQISLNAEEVVAAAAPGHIVTRLDRGKMGEADAAFKLTPLSETRTKVVWTYHAKTRENVPVYLQPISTYLGYVMDPILGPSYEQGLANLKRVAEAG